MSTTPLLSIEHLTVRFGASTVVFPLASIALIVAGWRDHQRFQRLQVEMRAFMAARTNVE